MEKKLTSHAGPLRTLGPISDLERHLPSDWWKTLFNSLYLKTDGDVVENHETTAREIDFIVRTARLEPNDRILDLCCGQGRHCLELARRGFSNVTGIDRSRYLVRLAKRRAKDAGVSVSFHEGDARKFRLKEDHFHYVTILGNSFGYFEKEDEDLSVLQAVAKTLGSKGTVIMDLVDGEWMRENFQARTWEWIDQNYFVCRERSLAKDGERLISREVITHVEKGVIADQFYAERLYSRERIAQLLHQAGFESIRFEGSYETQSDRAQDLGMMEHRIWITATAPVRQISVTKKGVLFPEVMVLLGDPGCYDPVKRDGQFNEEDFETIHKMKSALQELPEYRVEFFNQHAGMLSALRSDPPKFVFNLADEGWGNDPFKELHIPAVLDILGVPYTGAGPACLGLSYNKSVVRSIAASLDIPVPLESYFNIEDLAATMPSIFPALIKPNFGDGSVGITQESVVATPGQFVAQLERLRDIFSDCPILVQEFLDGPEYSVGIVGNPGMSTTVLPVLEVDYSGLDPELPKILGYESKYMPGTPYWEQICYRQAELSDEIQRKLIDFSTLLFERLGFRDYGRFDFRTDSEGEIKLLEVNPNPGWCWDGKLNIMAGFAGMRYAELLGLIIETAQERYAAECKKSAVGASVISPKACQESPTHSF